MHLERLHRLLEQLLEVHLEVVEGEHLLDGEGINRLVQQAGLLVLVLPQGVLVSQQAEVAGFLIPPGLTRPGGFLGYKASCLRGLLDHIWLLGRPEGFLVHS